ncbi:MAG: hypothetical protein PHE55_18725 [Methylococcaceae bacterium]|nr:hypothetical protein [Methylococcaceae bacterium]
MSDTIQLVSFRLQQDKTAADWLKANEKIDAWIITQPGFRFRSVSETEGGEWLAITYWESPEAAGAASSHFGEELGSICQPLIADGSVSISHSKAHTMLLHR